MGRSTGLVAVSLVLFLSWVASPMEAAPFNVTLMLNAFPSLTQMNQMLTTSGVADEINSRTSVTLLVISDPVLTSFLAAFPNAGTGEVADLLRYQCLLQYVDIPELKTITAGNPSTITTLYQTTGRAAGNSGSVNIYNDGTGLQVGQADVNSPPNATIVKNVTQIPYNISILQVDKVIAPTGFGAPVTSQANLTAILTTGKNFGTLIGLLQSTGVDQEFATRETGTGITIFAPNDAAFAGLPPGALAAATPAQKKLILEYHALTSYYTLGSLNTLNNPTAPTVATTDSTPGTYTLNVSTGASGVTISSGLSTATITSTLYDTPPTVVFSVATILLPPAIFAVAPAPSPTLVPASAPSPTNGTTNGTVPVPAPAPLSPASAPSPTPTSSPTPTPTPVPAPSPTSLAPGSVPAVSPGPPAPPGGITGDEPTASPEGSPSDEGNDATSTRMSLVVLAALAIVSSLAML